ncbi:MAG TPA: hypothetical protein VH561_06770 [Micromonosporaceae bacterium]|jgi:uncharacterized repeat protein (TIGR03943 family)
MRRYAQTALLLLLGGTLLKLAVTDTYLRYVRGVYLPLLVLAGAGLLVIGGVTLWRDISALWRPGEEASTGPIQIGGFFATAVLSAPDRPGTVAEPEPHTDAAPAESLMPTDGPGLETSTVDSRGRARAMGLAAAEHEGFVEAGTGQRPPGDIAGGMASANAPTATFTTVPTQPSGEARVGADGDASDGDAPDGHASEGGADPFDDETPVRSSVPVGGRGTRGGWALLVAALAILVLSPPALGSYPATRGGTTTVPGTDLPAIPSGDPAAMSLVDYTAHALAGGQALAGRRVRLVGFVVPGPRGEPYLARLAVGCCAAGARPVKVGLTGDLPGVLASGAWVEVIGSYAEQTDQDPVNGAPIAYVSVESVAGIDPPPDPYES